MRRAVLYPVLIAQASLSGAQQPITAPQVPSLLEGMRANSWTERSKAFDDAVSFLGSNKAGPSDADRMRVGIIRLLIKENEGGLKEDSKPQPTSATAEKSNNSGSENYDESYGEDKADYYAGLISFVAGLNDERAIPALLGAAGTGGIATRALARFGNKALDPVVAQLRSPDPDLASGALSVILQMLKSGSITGQDSHQRVKEALKSALLSPEYRIRKNAMFSVEYLDDRDEFVPMLQNIAEHDPYQLPYMVGNADHEGKDAYIVRRAARLLPTKIANHEPPPRNGTVE